MLSQPKEITVSRKLQHTRNDLLRYDGKNQSNGEDWVRFPIKAEPYLHKEREKEVFSPECCGADCLWSLCVSLCHVLVGQSTSLSLPFSQIKCVCVLTDVCVHIKSARYESERENGAKERMTGWLDTQTCPSCQAKKSRTHHPYSRIGSNRRAG